MIVIDSIDFPRAQPSPNRSEPEDLIHDFMTLTGIKVGHIRADGAGEFARSSTFKAHCKRHDIVIEEVPAYTHTFHARVEGAIRICKDRVRAFLRRANMPRHFWPDAYFIGFALMPTGPTPAVIPRGESSTNWGLTPSVMIVHVTDGFWLLCDKQPHVTDTTHDDRAEEGVFFGNDLSTPTFWLWRFKHKNAMRTSEPKYFDHILPFPQPADVLHAISLTAQDAFTSA
jgi:hypothetical protein